MKKFESLAIFAIGMCLGASVTLMMVANDLFKSECSSFSWEKYQFDEKKNVLSLDYLFKRNISAKTMKKIRENETELSDAIAKRIKILCWVMTHPENHKTKAQAVRETWGKRCDVFYFVSSQEVTLAPNAPNLDPNLPPFKTVIYKGNESRSNLWEKTQLGFKYAYDNHFDDADWFLKADDDTYVVMENLRLLLLDKDPSEPVYYGCRYKGHGFRNDWVGGGPGYVLSKEALKRFAEKANQPYTDCSRSNSGREDSELGYCLESVNVTVGDSTDPEGKPRFFHFQIYSMLNPRHKLSPLYWNTIATNHTVGEDCCSNSIIGLHYNDENMMRTLEYAIYKVHPFGINPILTGSNQINEIRNYLQQKISKNVTKTPNTPNPQQKI